MPGIANPHREPARLFRRFMSRVAHLAVFWFMIWPLSAVLAGGMNLMEYPATKEVPFWIAFPGVAVGVLHLIPEFLVSAAILFVVSAAVFVVFSWSDTHSASVRLLQPAIAYISLTLGVAFEFPAVLTNAVFAPLRHVTLLWAYVLLCSLLVAVGVLIHVTSSRRVSVLRAVVPGMILVTCGWLLTQVPVFGSGRQVNRGSTVVLGIDSLGSHMDLGTLRKFSRENGGAFYERAITPGLLTNAVWTAIIMHRPVRETGVMLTFQSPDWSRSPFQLVKEAENRGFQTWSFFTDQITSYVGSVAGFDHDQSGHMGWLREATCAAKNGSILLPFIVSRLPRIPFAGTPSNQAGTYAFDLRAVVRDILSSHEGPQPVFAVAHLGYLHDEVYPRFADLSPIYRYLVLGARVDSLRDFSAEWQQLRVAGDPIGLNAWKLENVQAVVVDEIRRSGFLDPVNHNKLVLLSDHGPRWRLTNDNFDKGAYHEVPLITFGLPVRDLREPISLLDIPSLIGFEDPTRTGPAEPAVEYVNLESVEEFKTAILEAKWLGDGRIEVHPDLPKKYLGLLKIYRPATANASASMPVSDPSRSAAPVLKAGASF
ncbi:MAG TPA: hypothetical protein VD837_15015 [Terriglobales bacterium]|nr:hypothetical protein [Terriglobales bacterium]